jgi:RimJ/RimL family protein N-acetyltransferase
MTPCLQTRPLEPADREALAGAFARLSPETRLLRFGTPKPRLSRRELDHLVLVDHHDHEALIAFPCDGGPPVAVGRFVRLPDAPGVAEVALTVADDWQGRGVGPRILRRLEARAREEGVRVLRADVLPENARAIRALRALGFERRGSDGGLDVFERAVGRAEPAVAP